MSDRELLELAAKAAEVFLTPKTLAEVFPEWDWEDEFEPRHKDEGGMLGTVVVYSYNGEASGTTEYYWNPMTDDGDALRLAVKLRMDVDVSDITSTPGNGCAWAMSEADNGAGASEPFGDDPNAATRRAIVRAAAAIGEAME